MNMHGFITPVQNVGESPSVGRMAAEWIRSHRPFLLLVVLPVLLVAGYLYLVAADQYETEAHFTIQSPGSNSSAPSGFGEFLGLSSGMSSSQSQAMGVADYLSSQEAVNTLRSKENLVERFRRPEADPFYKLHPANPTPERLLKYYSSMVEIRYNRDTGISTLLVRSFRPKDSYDIIRSMLELGEQRVNQLNQRAYNDAVSSSQRQLNEAEANARNIEHQMTVFRQAQGDVDPSKSGEAQTMLVKTLTANLSAARAQLSVIAKMVGPHSPQYSATAARVASMQSEIARQTGELTGGQRTIAGRLGSYEDLKVRQEFAAKRYDAAAAALEKARDQASKQSLYLVRVVDPSMPVKALYPKRLQIITTLSLVLLVSYGIGWLIIAGVREHSI